jgi:hypothetical protein
MIFPTILRYTKHKITCYLDVCTCTALLSTSLSLLFHSYPGELSSRLRSKKAEKCHPPSSPTPANNRRDTSLPERLHEILALHHLHCVRAQLLASTGRKDLLHATAWWHMPGMDPVVWGGGGQGYSSGRGKGVQGWVKISKSATKVVQCPTLPCLCQKNGENWGWVRTWTQRTGRRVGWRYPWGWRGGHCTAK